jgi:hypothetical protein
MLSRRFATQFAVIGSIALLGCASSVLADVSPYDPHVLYATGGDATNITGTSAIIFSSAGGGIFVYHNDTGVALASLDVDVAVPDALSMNGFSVTGAIVVPSGEGTQRSEFTAGFVTGSDCNGPSSTTFCELMTFNLIPGPLVPIGGNFVLDFDDPVNGVYVGLDAEVANGSYTGDTMTGSGQIGSWGAFTMGSVTPILATPEPAHYAGLLAGMVVLAIYLRIRRRAVAS